MAKNGDKGDDRLASHDSGFRENEQATVSQAQGGGFSHDGTHELADYERRRKLREMWDERILPNLPDSNQMHRCWVSTTHPIDTVQRRKRFGYRFVAMDD